MKITLNLDTELVQWLKSLEPVTAEQAILDVLRKNIGIAPVEKALVEFKGILKTFPGGIEFEVPQVFGSARWSQFDRSTKLSLGKRIRAEASNLGLEFLHKTASNHAVYRRQ